MNRLWRILPVLLLLLAQPAAPMVLAHGGQEEGHHEAPPPAAAQGTGPNATRLTPDRRYVEQRNPDAAGSMVVWQERELGRDWDIVAKNLTLDGSPFAVTIGPEPQTHPVVQGPWIAWVEDHGNSSDIVVLNLRSGEEIEIPDTGSDDVHPAIGNKKVYWMALQGQGVGVLRGFDLVERKMLYPIENVTIVAPPDAHGRYLTWAEGNNLDAKLRVRNVETGETWSAPGFSRVVDGPAIGRWGVAFIAQVHGAQAGTYTELFNWTRGNVESFQTGKYPHENVDVCDTGVVWDQFAPQVDNKPTVTIWDGYIDRTIDFGYDNHNADCSGDAFIYEKVVPGEDEDLGKTRHLYILDLATVRAPAKATIELDPGLERAIYKDQASFSGTMTVGDPRAPLQEAWARVDGGKPIPVQVRPSGQGTYRWSVTFDTSRYFNGQHSLNVIAIDEEGTETRQGFVFFTHGLYQTSDEVFEQGLNVPVERSPPFPLSILDHYQDYQPFYNTVLLVLFLLVLIAYFIYRWISHKPPAPPEYVPPESSDL